MALPSTTTTYHDDGNGHDDDDDDERRLPRATHTRGGGVCGRYGRTKGLFAPLGGLERLLHPTTLPILHRACASKAAHTTLLFRPAATLHLLEERPSTPPPRPLLPLLEGVHFDLSNPRPSSSSSHAEREKQLLSPSPSIQITPPFHSPPRPIFHPPLWLSSPSTSSSRVSLFLPFVFSSYFFFLFVFVAPAQPRLGHFHHGNEDRAEEIFDLQGSSPRCTLVNWRLRGRYFPRSGLFEIAGGWVFVLRIWIGRGGLAVEEYWIGDSF